MLMRKVYQIIPLLCSFFIFFHASGQEEAATVYQGKRYLDINIHHLEKYNKQTARQQNKLLAKLKRRERKYANKLKRNDSAGYAQYRNHPMTYDSIGKLSKATPNTNKVKSSETIDSLKKIKNFLQAKDPFATETGLDGYDGKLGNLDQQTSYRNYISGLIDKRTNGLKAINNNTKGKVGGFTSIEKNAFYGKEKIKVFKQIADEPSKAEDKAFEFLQGQEGFSKSLKDNKGMNGLPENASTSDLEKIGIQTKRQESERLQNRFGKEGLPNVQEKMSKQIEEFKDKTKDIKSAVNNAKQTKQSLKSSKNIETPSFKVNPMRALPFSKRIEKQYNWQTTRASIDGKQPASMQLSAMVGFKHTPRLSYGMGVATSIGLGQSWSNVHFSFVGVGIRTYAQWKWQYGVGAYAGYERMYKRAAFTNKDEVIPEPKENAHNTKIYNESILIGLTKSYRINDKWNGSVQLLYDIWYKEKGMRSPIMLRFATQKN
jgi:hypothetical protein